MISTSSFFLRAEQSQRSKICRKCWPLAVKEAGVRYTASKPDLKVRKSRVARLCEQAARDYAQVVVALETENFERKFDLRTPQHWAAS